MKKCHFCLKEIQSEAIKCRHCQNWLGDDQGENVEESKTQQPHVLLKNIIFNRKALYFWLFFIATALLVIAVFIGREYYKGSYKDNDDFYIFLRLYIFCISVYFILLKRKSGSLDALFPFVVVGVIFNPFIPFRFDNDFLNTIKIFVAGFFGYFSYREYQRLKKI